MLWHALLCRRAASLYTRLGVILARKITKTKKQKGGAAPEPSGKKEKLEAEAWTDAGYDKSTGILYYGSGLSLPRAYE